MTKIGRAAFTLSLSLVFRFCILVVHCANIIAYFTANLWIKLDVLVVPAKILFLSFFPLIFLHARSKPLKPPLCGVLSPAAIVSAARRRQKNICKPTPKAWAFLPPIAAAAKNISRRRRTSSK